MSDSRPKGPGGSEGSGGGSERGAGPRSEDGGRGEPSRHSRLKKCLRFGFGTVVGVIGISLAVNGERGHHPWPITDLMYATAALLAATSDRVLTAWWSIVVIYKPRSDVRQSIPPKSLAGFCRGWPLANLVALVALVTVSATNDLPGVAPIHPVAFVAAVGGSAIIELRVVMRHVAGQVKRCPNLFSTTRLEARSAFTLSLAGAVMLMAFDSMPWRIAVLGLALPLGAASMLLILDADARTARILRDEHAPALSAFLSGFGLVGRLNRWITARLEGGIGDRALRVVWKCGALIVLATALSGPVVIAAAGANLFVPHHRVASKPRQASAQHLNPRPASGAPAGGDALALPSTPVVVPKSMAAYTALCGALKSEWPGGDDPSTPRWAREELIVDWLGKDTGPGASVAGCPTHLMHLSDGFDDVYYQYGVLDGHILSLGVATSHHGGAIFLADGGAESAMDAILRSGSSASGSARQNVGNGDFQLIYDAQGTTLLVRPTKHRTGDPTDSTPYTIVPAAAMPAWLTATREFGVFLWPTLSSNNSDVAESIELSTAPYGPEVAQIDLGPGGSTDSLRVGGNVEAVPKYPLMVTIGE